MPFLRIFSPWPLLGGKNLSPNDPYFLFIDHKSLSLSKLSAVTPFQNLWKFQMCSAEMRYETFCMFLLVAWQIWHCQTPFVLLKIGRQCISDLFLPTWKGTDSSPTSKFGGLWTCLLYVTKLARSSHNIVSNGSSPQNNTPSITTKGGWRKTEHHLKSAATKLFLLGCKLAF